MTSDQQYLPIEVTIATNYVISFLYNKLPRRRVDVFAEELQTAINKKLTNDNQQALPQRATRIAVSPPLEIDSAVADAIRSSGLTVEEVVQELPLALQLFIEAGEVSYCIGSQHGVEPIPIYSTRRALSENGGLNGQNAFLNPSVEAAGLLDGVDPSLLALLSIRPLNNQSTAAVPTAVFAQTKFGSTKFRSQNSSGNARRPSRLNGTPQNGNSQPETPLNHRSNGVNGNGGVVRSSNASTPNGWVGSQSTTPSAPQSGIVSPTSRYQQNENIFSSQPLPPVVTSAAAAVLGGSSSCNGSTRSSNGYRTPSDFAYLLQDLPGTGSQNNGASNSSISSPALSEFAPSLTGSFDSNLLRGGLPNNPQRHSYHGNSQHQQNQNGTANNNNNNNIPSSFFPNSSSNGLGSLLFDSGIVSPSSLAASSWSSSTPVSSTSRPTDKLAHVQQNATFSDHSNSSSTSSTGSLSLFNGSLNGGNCGTDSWGLGGGSSSGNNNAANAFCDNSSITGTSNWVQSLRLSAAVAGGSNGWDQLTATES